VKDELWEPVPELLASSCLVGLVEPVHTGDGGELGSPFPSPRREGDLEDEAKFHPIAMINFSRLGRALIRVLQLVQDTCDKKSLKWKGVFHVLPKPDEALLCADERVVMLEEVAVASERA
jgi:hypothetical protein